MSEFTQRIRSAIDNEMHGPGEPWEHALRHRIKALVIEAEYWNEIPKTEQPQSLREHANDCLKGRTTDLDCVGTEGGKVTTTTIKP